MPSSNKGLKATRNSARLNPDVKHNKMKIKMISLLIRCLTFHIGCAEKSLLPKAKDIVEFKVNSISTHASVKDFKIENVILA